MRSGRRLRICTQLSTLANVNISKPIRPGQRYAMTDIRQIAQAMQFTPSNAQIRHRNAFWAQPGLQVPQECDLASATKLSPSGAVTKCLERSWGTPGFQEWFLHPAWEAEEAHRLLLLGMRRVAEVLRDAEDTDTVLDASKEARAIYAQVTQQTGKQEKFADAAIQEMTPEELREFIRRNTAAVAAK